MLRLVLCLTLHLVSWHFVGCLEWLHAVSSLEVSLLLSVFAQDGDRIGFEVVVSKTMSYSRLDEDRGINVCCTAFVCRACRPVRGRQA
jgi:hypothetical protein